MAWSAGSTRTVGDLITAAIWNQFHGVGNNWDILSNGTRILDTLVYETSLNSATGPIEGAGLTSRTAVAGGMQWEEFVKGDSWRWLRNPSGIVES